jgi:hypothetical protein
MAKVYRTFATAKAKCPEGSYVDENDNGKGFVIHRFPKTPKESWPPKILDSWNKQR